MPNPAATAICTPATPDAACANRTATPALASTRTVKACTEHPSGAVMIGKGRSKGADPVAAVTHSKRSRRK